MSALLGLLRSLARDLRLWLLLVPAVAVLLLDAPVAASLGYALAVVFVVAAVAHVVRKIVMPYVDLDVVVARACEAPGGAGSVFLGVCVLLAAMVLSAALWLAR